MTIGEHIEKTKKLMEDHQLKLFSPALYEEIAYLIEYIESIIFVTRVIEDSEEEDDIAGSS